MVDRVPRPRDCLTVLALDADAVAATLQRLPLCLCVVTLPGRLVALHGGTVAVPGRFVALSGGQASGDSFAGAGDGLLHALLQVFYRLAPRRQQSVILRFPFICHLLAPVGDPVPLVGDPVPLVGDPVPLGGKPVPRLGDPSALRRVQIVLSRRWRVFTPGLLWLAITAR